MFVSVAYHVDSAAARLMLSSLELKMSAAPMAAFMQSSVVSYIQTRIANRFAQEGDDVSGPWHPLAQETEVIRQRHGYPGAHPINVRTGQLRAFTTGSFGDVLSGGGNAQLSYPAGSNMTTQLMRKLLTAQMGSAYPVTPARPVLGFNMDDNIALTALVAGYMTS